MDDRDFAPDSLLVHAGFVRRIARALVRDEHAAEDVVQRRGMGAKPAALLAGSAWLRHACSMLRIALLAGLALGASVLAASTMGRFTNVQALRL